jgi:hypothetical protein
MSCILNALVHLTADVKKAAHCDPGGRPAEDVNGFGATQLLAAMVHGSVRRASNR